jgi:hypothetical protein
MRIPLGTHLELFVLSVVVGQMVDALKASIINGLLTEVSVELVVRMMVITYNCSGPLNLLHEISPLRHDRATPDDVSGSFHIA